jgi:hypothetical protein
VVGGEPAGVWPRDVDTRSRRSEGKEFAAHPSWLAGRGLRRGAMAMDRDDAPGVAAGVLGSFPLGNPRCWLTGAVGARRVCQPADWSSHRPRARVRRDARRYSVVRCWGKGEEEEIRETDTWVPHVSEREGKKKGSGCWAAWLRCLMGPLGYGCRLGWAGG